MGKDNGRQDSCFLGGCREAKTGVSSIIIRVLYNGFIERQPEFCHPLRETTFGAGPAMIGVGVYWTRQSLKFIRDDA